MLKVTINEVLTPTPVAPLGGEIETMVGCAKADNCSTGANPEPKSAAMPMPPRMELSNRLGTAVGQ